MNLEGDMDMKPDRKEQVLKNKLSTNEEEMRENIKLWKFHLYIDL